MDELRKKIADLLISDLSLTEKLACAAASYRVADWLVENGVTIPVRCKECEFFKDTWTSDDGGVYGYCPHLEIEHSEDGYCHYGKRLENGN